MWGNTGDSHIKTPEIEIDPPIHGQMAVEEWDSLFYAGVIPSFTKAKDDQFSRHAIAVEEQVNMKSPFMLESY